MNTLLDKLKTKNFPYTGNKLTEREVLANGHSKLSGEELFLKISNKTVYGDYPMGYKFVADINKNGLTNGVNNVGFTDIGKWKIDFETDTLQLVWSNAWINTITRAYEINGKIEFFDIETGSWRTTFKIIESLKKE